MSVVLPAFFAIVTMIAVLSMHRSIQANVDSVRELHQQVKLGSSLASITVALRVPEQTIETPALPRRRQRHVNLPKPVTHRLHHLVPAISVA